MAAALAATGAASTSSVAAAAATKNARSSGNAQNLGSMSSSLRGNHITFPSCNLSSHLKHQQRKNIAVVSPRAVSDSPVVADALLNPDASRVSSLMLTRNLMFDVFSIMVRSGWRTEVREADDSVQFHSTGGAIGTIECCMNLRCFGSPQKP